MELNRCIDCNGVGQTLDFAFPLERCNSCKLVFASRWTSVLTEDHSSYYQARITWPIESFLPELTLSSLAKTLDHLSRVAPGAKLLDVGCGEGILVHVANTKGWNAQGIDRSPSAINIARTILNSQCTTADFFEIDGKFDVITMIETIEHVPHPSKFFQRAKEVLAPGGILYLTTPNFSSLSRRLLRDSWSAIGGDHISYFEPNILRTKVALEGFIPLRIRTKNIAEPTLRKILHRDAPLLRPATELTSGTCPETNALRAFAEHNRVGRVAKSVTNSVLNWSNLGDTIEAIFKVSL